MKKEFICVVCPAGCHLTWEDGEVSGYGCKRGIDYANTEMTAPKRSVSSTVVLKGSKMYTRLPVKTAGPIDKALVVKAVKSLDGVCVEVPIKIGDVVLENAASSGVDFVASRSVEK